MKFGEGRKEWTIGEEVLYFVKYFLNDSRNARKLRRKKIRKGSKVVIRMTVGWMQHLLLLLAFLEIILYCTSTQPQIAGFSNDDNIIFELVTSRCGVFGIRNDFKSKLWMQAFLFIVFLYFDVTGCHPNAWPRKSSNLRL